MNICNKGRWGSEDLPPLPPPLTPLPEVLVSREKKLEIRLVGRGALGDDERESVRL